MVVGPRKVVTYYCDECYFYKREKQMTGTGGTWVETFCTHPCKGGKYSFGCQAGVKITPKWCPYIGDDL